MAYRFTNTEKWCDSWFSSLNSSEKLLFIYLCDNCDCAGFFEINKNRISSDLKLSLFDIEGALKGLARGFVLSKENDCLYIRNFLKHQKNLPLNKNNKAHIGIIKRFEIYSYKFDINDINEFIEQNIKGAYKGLQSPLGIGIGIGIGIGDGKSKEEPTKFFADEKVANEIFDFFSIDKNHPSSQPKISKVKWFLDELQKHEQIAYFDKSFNNYRIYQLQNPGFRHSFDNFLGDIGGDVYSGKWNSENWEYKIKESINKIEKSLPQNGEIRPISRQMVY